jgi:hypothetical protein
MAVKVYSDAWEKLIHEKKQKSKKSRDTVPLTMLCASNGFQISAPEPATAAKEEATHENGEKDEKKQNEEQEQEKEGPKETE